MRSPTKGAFAVRFPVGRRAQRVVDQVAARRSVGGGSHAGSPAGAPLTVSGAMSSPGNPSPTGDA